MNFAGKKCLITGAGKGIGRALARKMLECKAEVFALSRTLSDLESLKVECPSINIIQCDLSNISDLEAKVNSCGAIDLLVNNAAVAICESLFDLQVDSIDKQFEVNLRAPLLVTKIVAKKMVDRKCRGSIVNVSSQAGLIGLRDHAAYGATKGAIDNITKTLSLELGAHNIRVNAVNPTVTLTDMALIGWSEPAKADKMKSYIPLGRFAEVHEVVSVIMFLLSDNSSMVNGVCLPVDGGAVASMNT